MYSISLEELNKISKIVGKHSSQNVARMLKFKEVMLELKLEYHIPIKLHLIRTCTGCNCICWKSGIKGICIPYDTCLRCYKKIKGLKYCPVCD
jgi:hypothetical protein